MGRRGAGFALLLCAGMTAGCGAPRDEVRVADVPPGLWERAVEVRIPNTDTVSLRELWVTVRTNNGFAADSLALDIETTAPDSVRFAERVVFYGVHRRTPASLMHDTLFPYRSGAVLGLRGDYRFVFTPADGGATGVEAVGIRIVKSAE